MSKDRSDEMGGRYTVEYFGPLALLRQVRAEEVMEILTRTGLKGTGEAEAPERYALTEGYDAVLRWHCRF
jgi:hypothetical protein